MKSPYPLSTGLVQAFKRPELFNNNMGLGMGFLSPCSGPHFTNLTPCLSLSF